MFLLDWYEKYLQLKQDYKVCQTCDYLKNQLEIERNFNKILMEKLTKTPEPITMESKTPEPIVRPSFIPWRTRRQLLEAEDKRAAQVMQDKEKELQKAKDVSGPSGGVQIAANDDPDVIALEKEMDIIAQEREDAGQVR
jgi:hypothetical protein